MKSRQNSTFGRPEYIGDADSRGAWTDFRPLKDMGFPVEFAMVLDHKIPTRRVGKITAGK